jgi:hypothetical protein
LAWPPHVLTLGTATVVLIIAGKIASARARLPLGFWRLRAC